MTTPDHADTIDALDELLLGGMIEGLRDLQSYCFESADTRGFHDEGRALLEAKRGIDELVDKGILNRDDRDVRAVDFHVRNYWGNRLMLIVGEAVEAHEELRAGRLVDERYYSDDGKSTAPKPEGVPSELADIVIRVLDLAGEAKVDLAAVIEEKLEFNSTRSRMHGKKF